MSCCNCTYKIEGCFNVCFDIDIALVDIDDGSYTVIDTERKFSFTATATDGILTIPSGSLNESDCNTLQIVGYSLILDGKDYNCFKVSTYYAIDESIYLS
jgi:hypothetical protein